MVFLNYYYLDDILLGSNYVCNPREELGAHSMVPSLHEGQLKCFSGYFAQMECVCVVLFLFKLLLVFLFRENDSNF